MSLATDLQPSTPIAGEKAHLTEKDSTAVVESIPADAESPPTDIEPAAVVPESAENEPGTTSAVSFTADSSHRQAAEPFDAEIDAKSDGNTIIEALIANVPGLKLYTRSSPRYGELRAVYNLRVTSKPLVVCRPTTIEQVQGIVKTASSLKAPLAIRAGGHDLWGRACIEDSVTIDMRELDSQELAEDKQSIKIGGGILSGNFVSFLDTHGLCTVQGTAQHVGWTGWAMWGGYGLFNDSFGLGVDNILAAKVVTADGELIEADQELLWGIRGAGGNLGVVVETTVRVYHLPRIVAGFVVYAWDEVEMVLIRLQELLDRGAPNALCVQMGFIKNEWGHGAAMHFLWADRDLEEGKKWLDKIRSLGTVVADTTSETTFKEFQNMTSRPVNYPVYIHSNSVSTRRLTAGTVSEVKKAIEAIPDTRQYNIIAHITHGKGSKPNLSSCFATREPHVLFHINASDDADKTDDGLKWVNSVVAGLKATKETIAPVYVSFMGQDQATDRSFGDGWNRLKALKKKHDANNVFQFAQPKLPVE